MVTSSHKFKSSIVPCVAQGWGGGGEVDGEAERGINVFPAAV